MTSAALPTDTAVRSRGAIALVQREGRNDKAQAFQDFVMSESGQQVLAKYGFAKP